MINRLSEIPDDGNSVVFVDFNTNKGNFGNNFVMA